MVVCGQFCWSVSRLKCLLLQFIGSFKYYNIAIKVNTEKLHNTHKHMDFNLPRAARGSWVVSDEKNPRIRITRPGKSMGEKKSYWWIFYQEAKISINN